jgi:PAS domain S-box-containing protein
MIARTVTAKLLIFVTLAFFTATAGILLFTEKHVNQLLDTSQTEVYSEKIHLILSILERTNQRLESTGLIEVYTKSFQNSAIKLLEETYYKGQQTHPIVIDQHGKIIIAAEQDKGLDWLDLLQQDTALLDNNQRTFIFNDHWIIHKSFPAWGWHVLYSIPLEQKYQETRRLNITLSLIMFGTALCVLLLLFLILSRLMRPVRELTDLTAKIAQGDLDCPVRATTNDEFGTLANSFETMRQAINRKIRNLKDKEADLSVTLNSIGDGVITTDTGGLITRTNAVAQNLTGRQESDMLGKPLEAVLSLEQEGDDNNTLATLTRLLLSDKPARLPEGLTLPARNGKEHIVSISAAPIRSPEEGLIGSVIVLRDITEERAMQEQLQHDRRMQAIGQLAGGVAHDFNNLLTGIAGATDLLERRLADSPEELKYLELIRSSTAHAAGLTQKLLSFSRKGTHVSCLVDLHQIIDEVISILERSIDKKIIIHKDLGAHNATVNGDPAQLQSGLLNLCLNARDAMPNGGIISITTSNTNTEQDHNNDLPAMYDDSLKISIEDNGSGIPYEVQERIFEPFFTTKDVDKGTGLGLAAVYGMIKDHQGNVRFHSAPGHGTIFHIYLPTTTDKAPPKNVGHPEVIRGSGTVLVIDDEEIVRATVSLLLENLGYQVLLAVNGREGVNLYQQQRGNIDLVILDMIMPVMNGRETFERIIAADPHARVILASGFAKDLNMPRMTTMGLAGFIMKPFNLSQLSELIANVMAKKI